MDYIPLPDNAARQAIDSFTIFTEWRKAVMAARPYAGGMYFKKEGAYEYLVKTAPNNQQQRLGRRTPDTEATLDAFTRNKRSTEERRKSLDEALIEATRLNKALKVGRAPNIVVSVLNALEDADLGQHFTVVGTHALYVYETAASVRIVQGALATQDVDLLWDARKRVQFLATMQRLHRSVLSVLQEVEPTFRRMDDQLETAIDAKGFQVDFLRRETAEGDQHPFRFTDDEEDLWPVQARRAEQFLSAPRFEQPVISTTGRMALVRTVDPQVFVDFKRWMSGLQDRPPGKRRRDERQASIVQKLLDEGLLRASA
ncbi:GSU2403 family nucleotidyltransferase fold protein [Xylophilus sp. GW821-FHT01B05]